MKKLIIEKLNTIYSEENMNNNPLLGVECVGFCKCAKLILGTTIPEIETSEITAMLVVMQEYINSYKEQ